MLMKRGYSVQLSPDVVSVVKFVEKFGIAAERSQLRFIARHSTPEGGEINVVRGHDYLLAI